MSASDGIVSATRRIRARVDARGWWRIGPVRIEPKQGENPADRKALAMRLESFLNGESAPSQSRRMCPVTFEHMAHDSCDGSPAPSSTRLIDLHEAAHDLLVACGMEEKNEAIRHGASGKAWDGSFVRKMKLDAMQRVRDLTESSGQNVASAIGESKK